MRKKSLCLIMTLILTVSMLAGCGNENKGGGAGETGSNAVSGKSEQTVSGTNSGNSGTDKLSEKYSDTWIGKLKPTGQKAKEYPFTQFGETAGYIPDMMPDEVKDKVISLGMEFTGFFVRENKGHGYSSMTWEEVNTAEDVDYIQVCVKNKNEGMSDTVIVKYSLYSPFEKGQKYQVKDVFEKGTYQVIGNRFSGTYLRSSFFGFKGKEGNYVDGGELIDMIIEKWGMPSYIYAEEVIGQLAAYICYECDDYIVFFEVMGKTPKVTNVHMFDIKYKDWMEEYIGGKNMEKW